jgi:two-component system chemotaxis response regulator CheB
MPARVLVVDDSAFMRKVIPQMLAGVPELEVVGSARDGEDALEQVKRLKPDLMTLDCEMPKVDGLEVLRRLKSMQASSRPKVVMCSSLTREGSEAALTAMSLGASGFVAKDASVAVTGLDELKSDLVKLLVALSAGVRRSPMQASVRPVQVPIAQLPARVDLIAIGSSTGGPPVLEAVLSALPATLPCPVVVCQHMPPLFTKSLADRLRAVCKVNVEHAEEGVVGLKPGTAYIVKGAMNGHIEKPGASLLLRVKPEPREAVYKPSVDVLLETAGAAAGKHAVGVVLTGMGEDGLLGGRALVAAGGMILAQDEESCVVWGMPRAVTVAGLASVAKPQEIGRHLAGAGRGVGRLAG